MAGTEMTSAAAEIGVWGGRGEVGEDPDAHQTFELRVSGLDAFELPDLPLVYVLFELPSAVLVG